MPNFSSTAALLSALVAASAFIYGPGVANAGARDLTRPTTTTKETIPPTVREHTQTGPKPNPILKPRRHPHGSGIYTPPPFQGARDHRAK